MKAGRLSNEREKRASGTHMHDLQPVYGVLRVKPASPFKRSSFPQSDKKKVLQNSKCTMDDSLIQAEQALSDGDFAAADRLARGVLQAGTSYEALV